MNKEEDDEVVLPFTGEDNDAWIYRSYYWWYRPH
jgi:hypothetical protein